MLPSLFRSHARALSMLRMYAYVYMAVHVFKHVGLGCKHRRSHFSVFPAHTCTYIAYMSIHACKSFMPANTHGSVHMKAIWPYCATSPCVRVRKSTHTRVKYIHTYAKTSIMPRAKSSWASSERCMSRHISLHAY
jgi:hypothetical protein